MAQIIPFPAARVVRSSDYVGALEKLALLDDYELSGDPVKMAIVAPMREFWTQQLLEAGGVGRPVHDLSGGTC